MNDRLLRVLRGERVSRRPLWIMRQAGRYLPEYRALREKHAFLDLCRDPELAAEVTRMPLRRFPLDAAIVFADLMSPVAALGVPFTFDPGPVLERPLRTAAAIDALAGEDPDAIAPEVLETLKILKADASVQVPVLGFAGAPWSLAAYLVEGRGRRDFPALRALAAADPAALGRLLARLARLVASYGVQQARAGADAVQVFDTWAGLLSRADWERIARPSLVTVLEALGAAGVPRIIFFQGAPHLMEAYACLPAECVAVDWRVDIAMLHRVVAGRKAVQGNLDPALLQADPAVVRAAVRGLLARVPRDGHIVNLGHGILPEARIDSVEALIEVVHAEGREA